MITNNKNIKTLLVGGAVRDLLLGKKPHDFDFLIARGTADEFISEFPAAHPVGKSYEIFFMKGFEFSLPRLRGKTTGETIDLDLCSRDFTVNSFAIDEDGELYCHPDALEDITNKTLRLCFAQSFKEDPLRVFRVATFLARFPDFTPNADLLLKMREASSQGWLAGIAPDRIGVELRKALAASQPGNFIRILSETDCLEPWFSEFSNSDEIPAGPSPFHDKTVLGHTAEMMDKVAGDSITCWMAMCHDLGKTLTAKNKLPSHHGHDKSGIAPALKLGRRLLLPTKFIQAGEIAAKLHMKAGNYMELRPATKVDLLMKLHVNGLLENMISLTHADRGEDVMKSATSELAEILKVSLPVEDRNLGPKSGEKLRSLRSLRLKSFRRGNNWQNLLK
ncbi:polynucleotide adenylyltransferase [Maridesulfovibrio zosterae]|uniref:polynucleotide adenylyltransferase n=1 Tax=Maridesulfovibrio zosterae TaxID=82171 RepID=UPI0004054FD1|nr:polynucleotide adenylyltransferase [Maridesulfovibrio zosterae]